MEGGGGLCNPSRSLADGILQLDSFPSERGKRKGVGSVKDALGRFFLSVNRYFIALWYVEGDYCICIQVHVL